MKYKEITLPAFEYIGYEIRTKNEYELDENRAKIPQAWEYCNKNRIIEFIDQKVNPTLFYGLYTDYDNEDKEFYTLSIGSKVIDNTIFNDDLIPRAFPESKYLKFTTNEGPFPQNLMDCWSFIWNFFQNNDQYVRSYLVDFEEYDRHIMSSSTTPIVHIYIAIK